MPQSSPDDTLLMVWGRKDPEFPYDQNLLSKKEFDSWSREDQIAFVSHYQSKSFLDGWNTAEAAARKARGEARLKRLKDKFISLLGY